MTRSGHLILINGPSSAGKSTLAHALRDALPVPCLHFSLDFFMLAIRSYRAKQTANSATGKASGRTCSKVSTAACPPC